MNKTESCFLKVKNDYLKFLKKEKIFNKSKSVKIKILKLMMESTIPLIKRNERNRRLFFKSKK